ncbi:hypothetical protein ONS95_003069 [Cadophora gregata]|uniref:uncharacterized protein n=1 Tax=Cadophora gregata TaxID=51156 RepID=UPI0026DC515D|nr:uncharacterized protein ONS95_003069 [Cadophora gregata]KAK0108251.1 hypothetical protein ONS95_003069 [Cadophora gregata]KAK0109158.1 hypothetical protein ONS96_002982 [Cadophora gregata f. sp. sojae]
MSRGKHTATLWSTFEDGQGDDDTESDSDGNLETYTYNYKRDYDYQTEEFWKLWNEKIACCLEYMTTEQLSQRMTTGRYPLGCAIQYANTDTISLMFTKGVDVNTIDTKIAATALDFAAMHGCESTIANFLISNTRRPLDDFTGNQKRNPLQASCTQPRSLDLLRQLLAAGASSTLPDRDGANPLMMAAGSGNVGALKILLKHKVPTDTQRLGSGSTALHCAAVANSADCVLALLKAGAKVDIKSEAGNSRHSTPLLFSAIAGHWDIAEILIKHGTPPSTFEVSGGQSIIHLAASAGQLQILRLILDQPEKPDLNAKDKDGFTPLHLAASKGDVSCFQLLLDNGAVLETGTELNGGIEHSAVASVSNDVRKILLDHKVSWQSPSLMNVNRIDYMEVLPLHRAAMLGNDSCIHFLKDNGFIKAVDVLAEFGMTALHFAVYTNQFETVKILLDMGANAESVESRYGRTPLITAARCNSTQALQVLLDHGCEIDAADSSGMTAHMVAIASRSSEAVATLKKYLARSDRTLDSTPLIRRQPQAKNVSFAPGRSSSPNVPENSIRIQELLEQLLEEYKPKSTRNIQSPVSPQGVIVEEEEAESKRVQTQIMATENDIPMLGTEGDRSSIAVRLWSATLNRDAFLALVAVGVLGLLIWVAFLLHGVNKEILDIRRSVHAEL